MAGEAGARAQEHHRKLALKVVRAWQSTVLALLQHKAEKQQTHFWRRDSWTGFSWIGDSCAGMTMYKQKSLGQATPGQATSSRSSFTTTQGWSDRMHLAHSHTFSSAVPRKGFAASPVSLYEVVPRSVRW
jgi:hypothetical protein